MRDAAATVEHVVHAHDGRGSQRCMVGLGRSGADVGQYLPIPRRCGAAVAIGRWSSDQVRSGATWAGEHTIRQHTPDFNRFHSSLGLLPKSSLVKLRHCGSSERCYYSPMAVDHRTRRRGEPVRCPDRRVLIASPARRGCVAGAGGVDPWIPRCPSACHPGASSCGRPTHQPSGPWLFTGLYADE